MLSRKTRRFPQLAACVLLGACIQLAACGSKDAAPACDGSANLLADPAFSSLTGARRNWQWSISEHAGIGSFAYEVEDGVLSIRKTGKEPWALVSQAIDTSGVPGRKLHYRAEIKLDLQPPDPFHGFKQGGGLSITVQKQGRQVLRSVLEHEPHMGASDWAEVSVNLDLPPGKSAVLAGLLHQANGVLEIRNPSLTISTCPR